MADNAVKTDNRVKYLIDSQEFGTLQLSYPAGTTDEEIARKQFVTVDEARKHIIRPEMPDNVKKGVKPEVLEPYPYRQPENIQGPAVIRYVKAAPYYESRRLGDKPRVYGRTDTEYDALINSALKKLTDREPFSYDPETDPDYVAYREQMTAAAESAYRRILNENNTSVFGASGAVLSEAAAAKNAALSKLPEVSAQFYERAYKRYTDETKRLRNELSDVSKLADTAYKRMREADDDEYTRARLAAQDLYKEDQRQFENTLSLREAERRDRQAALDAALSELEIEGQKNKNRSSAAAADTDELYAESYAEYLAALLAGMKLDNQIKEKEYNTKNSDYDSGYYRKRGQIDAILGIYRG